MEIKNNSKKIGIWIGTSAIFLVGFVSLFVGRKTVESPIIQTPLNPIDIKKQTTAYKDGSYSSTGSYMSPGGLDKIGVNLTLEKDIVTDISVTPLVADKVSVKYQGMFLSGYRPMVIGKNIIDVKLDKVSGSSLTSIGFNEAIEQIKLEAKS